MSTHLGRRIVVVSTSAVSVAALEVLLVSAARRLQYAITGPAPSTDSSRTSRWAHLLLREALASLQAELVARQLGASVAVERALVARAKAPTASSVVPVVPLVPAQRDRGAGSSRGVRTATSAAPVVRETVRDQSPDDAVGP